MTKSLLTNRVPNSGNTGMVLEFQQSFELMYSSMKEFWETCKFRSLVKEVDCFKNPESQTNI